MRTKPSNIITVYRVAEGGPISYMDAFLVFDAADYSVSIKRKDETVAHFRRDEYIKIVQEIK